MSYMFSECYALTSVGDLSNWDVSKVTSMDGMFGVSSIADTKSKLYIIKMNGNPSSLNTCNDMFREITTEGKFYYNSDYDYSKIIARLPETWEAIPITNN